MSGGEDLRVVFVDTIVLFSSLRLDLLLTLSSRLPLELRWSDEVIDELRRTLSEHLLAGGYPDGPVRVDRLNSQMERAFPGASVSSDDIVDIGSGWPDPNDEHVVRAAVKAGATHIATENLKDFPSEPMAPLGLVAMTSDALLTLLAETYPTETKQILGAWLKERKAPAYTWTTLTVRLEQVRLAGFANVLRHIWKD